MIEGNVKNDELHKKKPQFPEGVKESCSFFINPNKFREVKGMEPLFIYSVNEKANTYSRFKKKWFFFLKRQETAILRGFKTYV